ncbi:hypothetical protein CYMTET_36385, partial [Cymbomonas tetramitiformis]
LAVGPPVHIGQVLCERASGLAGCGAPALLDAGAVAVERWHFGMLNDHRRNDAYDTAITAGLERLTMERRSCAGDAGGPEAREHAVTGCWRPDGKGHGTHDLRWVNVVDIGGGSAMQRRGGSHSVEEEEQRERPCRREGSEYGREGGHEGAILVGEGLCLVNVVMPRRSTD